MKPSSGLISADIGLLKAKSDSSDQPVSTITGPGPASVRVVATASPTLAGTILSLERMVKPLSV